MLKLNERKQQQSIFVTKMVCAESDLSTAMLYSNNERFPKFRYVCLTPWATYCGATNSAALVAKRTHRESHLLQAKGQPQQPSNIKSTVLGRRHNNRQTSLRSSSNLRLHSRCGSIRSLSHSSLSSSLHSLSSPLPQTPLPSLPCLAPPPVHNQSSN